jgi:hypothetical protein
MKVKLKNKGGYALTSIKLNEDILRAEKHPHISTLVKVFVGNRNSYDGWLTFSKLDVEIVNEPKDDHYNNDNGSLYLFAQQHGLNAYEFDILKRVVRCRKKGQFISDLEKTKRVIDLYIKEQSSNQ